MERATAILDWYRADAWPRMRRVLVVGPALLSLGGLVVGVSFTTREPELVRSLAVMIGMALVAAGAGFTMAAMHRILRDDAYLAIRTDGLVFRLASLETLVAWDDLARARWDEARGELALERTPGDGGVERAALVVPRRFAGIAGDALVQKIEQARRRASMGYLS